MTDAFEDAWDVSKEFYFEQQDYEQPYREGRRNRRTGKVAKKPSRDIRGMRTARRHGYNVSDRNYRGDADAGQWATSVPQKGRRLSDAWNPNLSSEDEQARSITAPLLDSILIETEPSISWFAADSLIVMLFASALPAISLII